jgi:GNAT superfamily N-acetyltransferase
MCAMELDGKVAAVGGFFHEAFSYSPHAFAFRLEVHPRFQRRGIGRQLYDGLSSQAPQKRADGEGGFISAPHKVDRMVSCPVPRGEPAVGTRTSEFPFYLTCDLQGKIGKNHERCRLKLPS